MTHRNPSVNWDWLKLLCLTMMATLTIEHSRLDVYISRLFYTNGQWLLEKGGEPYALIFYNGPKLLLILLAVYLMVVLTIKYRQPSRDIPSTQSSQLDNWLNPLSVREISYLLIVLIGVPTVIATLKAVTHVSCPNQLSLFNGELPYLNLWQDIISRTPVRCFPAAHASAGFALYGFAYLPRFKRYRVKIIIAVSLLGWTMGLYKMAIGDHFFSHTLVSMLLAWTQACATATIIFAKRYVKNPTPLPTNIYKSIKK